jgi:hypothetical protein
MHEEMHKCRNPGKAKHSIYHVTCSCVSLGQCTRGIGTDQASAESGGNTKHRTTLCVLICAPWTDVEAIPGLEFSSERPLTELTGV